MLSRTTIRTTGGPVLAVIAGALLATNVAGAANYSLTGKYIDNRGTINLPLPDQLGGEGPGVPGAGTAMQTGGQVVNTVGGLGGPKTLTIPTNAFSDVPTITRGFLIPVPSVIQLTTKFLHKGPMVATTLKSQGGPGSFAYCPGAAANPNCTTAATGGNQGTLNGIVKYTAGANKFGGTFKMLLAGIGKLTYKGDALPPTVMTTAGGMTTALPFSAVNVALGGGLSGTGGQQTVAAGGFPFSPAKFVAPPYLGNMSTGTLSSSPATHPLAYKNTPMSLLDRCTDNANISKAACEIGTALSYFNQNTGFPVTTGTVYLYRKIAAQNDPGVGNLPSKITRTGYDKRTAAGAGRIQLVGGGLARQYPTDGSDPPEGSQVASGIWTISFTPQPSLPLASPPALLTLASLLALSAGFAISRNRMR